MSILGSVPPDIQYAVWSDQKNVHLFIEEGCNDFSVNFVAIMSDSADAQTDLDLQMTCDNFRLLHRKYYKQYVYTYE